MEVTGTDGEEITVVTTNTGFRISKGLWPPSSATTTSTGNKPSRYSRSVFSCMSILLILLTGTLSIIRG
jgi:hypothetical protein